MKPSQRVVVCVALAAASGILSSAAVADPQFRVDVSAASGTRNVQGPTDSRTQTSDEHVSLGATSGVVESDPGIRPVLSEGLSVASGSVGAGLMSLFASASASTNAVQRPSSGSASARAFGGLHDDFTILGANCLTCASGSRGTMTFAVSLQGGLSGSGQRASDVASSNGGGGFSFNSNWSSVFGLTSGFGNAGGTAGGTYRGTQDGDVTTSTGLGTGSHVFTLDFAFGNPIDLQWQSTINASGNVSSTGNEQSFKGETEAFANFAHTFAWGGILSVLDLNGAPVDMFTALNATGVDYAQSFASPVPEPETYPLMVAGLAAIGYIARRRKIQRSPLNPAFSSREELMNPRSDVFRRHRTVCSIGLALALAATAAQAHNDPHFCRPSDTLIGPILLSTADSSPTQVTWWGLTRSGMIAAGIETPEAQKETMMVWFGIGFTSLEDAVKELVARVTPRDVNGNGYVCAYRLRGTRTGWGDPNFAHYLFGVDDDRGP